MENRTIEQVINEGNAIIKAKDNEIENLKETAKWNYETKLQIHKDNLELRSNAHTYIKKISHQHNEIERQKKEITNVLNVLKQVQEERNELQNRFSTVRTIIFLLSGALLTCLISSVIIINELI